MRIGADFNNGNCEFTVWSPFAKSMVLDLVTHKKRFFMDKDEQNYWKISADIDPGNRYYFVINGYNKKPDPASNYQPEGIHGPSEVIDHNSFKWEDKSWKGIPLKEMIMYELHIGTFTKEGLFKSAIEKLDYLKELGINMIEIMPVAQFPGERNWGYDGVYPFAIQNSYGSCDDFKQLINESHKKNLGVILDVVYNHFGPEGNYTTQFAPYLTSRYKTEWGDAVNFDDEYSDHIRNFFIENALYWLKEFHIDALRLDAVHSIYDTGAKHFLLELKEKIEKFSGGDGRERFLIAESDLNDVKIINPADKGGYNMDAQWSDDFHHSVHSYLSGEKTGYYKDFGNITHINKALKDTFIYSGEYSEFRKKKHGSSAKEVDPYKFVISIQNHDQVGNRPFGKRLSHLVEFEKLKLAAGLIMLSPYIPMLFMGEEFAAASPFLYFVDHIDQSLLDAVRIGRREEFKSFQWQEEIPSPGSEETFLKSKINWESINEGRHKALLSFYKKLIHLRKTVSSFNSMKRKSFDVDLVNNNKVIIMKRWNSSGTAIAFFNLGESNSDIEMEFPKGIWKKLVESSSETWCGLGEVSPDEASGKSVVHLRKFSFSLYETK